MNASRTNRRQFLRTAGWASGAVLLGSQLESRAAADKNKRLHLACNEYPWLTFYRREKRDFHASLDEALGQVARSGVDGYEPLVREPDELDRLVPLLQKHGLQMRSLYVNSLLHEPQRAEASIGQVLTIARKARDKAGTKIVVTNPSPIRWGGPENKTDEQIIFQARALERLGRQLKDQGLTLAYHNHDMELRNAARELHHMLLATDPEHVTFCLDCHWIYRGAGNSAVALMDVLKLYGQRVSELHLRQSRGGIWTETLCDGDIDYAAIVDYLVRIGKRPHLVLEQSVEKDSPNTMDALAAHQQSSRYARRLFAPLAE